MKRLYAIISAGLLALLLGACSTSPPSRYYLLNAGVEPRGLGDTPAVGIGPVEIPEYLNRNALVYSESGNRLHVASSERWGEPLAAGIQRVLGTNLAAQLGTQNLQTYPWSPGQTPDFGVTLRIVSLDAHHNRAELLAEWELRAPADGVTVTRRLSRLQVDLDGGVTTAKLAPAYSELLVRLSEEIAAVIQAELSASE